jgi:cell cycle checkpoint control protein RAD9A
MLFTGVVKTHRLPLITQTTLMAPGVPDTENESRLRISPKAIKDMIDHFAPARSIKSDPQLIWHFGESEVEVKSLESSIDTRGINSLSPLSLPTTLIFRRQGTINHRINNRRNRV